MIFIENNNTNPYLNHAVEEHVMNKFNADCFMLWRNEPCILIGKNQNILAEINTDYVRKHDITVVRRMSGGGAVFNDLGNLNFTFIAYKSLNEGIDFKRFTTPIINALKKLGVTAELSGRNDLTINGKKFSGNAQFHYKGRVVHHGTLLFSSCMSDLVSALKVKEIKFSDKSVKSVASRVTNLSEHLNEPMSVVEFKNFLINSVIEQQENPQFYELTEEDWKSINEIAKNKYCTNLWNYGYLPKFNFTKEKKFLGGIVQANLFLVDDVIHDINLNGDFFSEKDVSKIENLLRGLPFKVATVKNALSTVNISEYMNNITLDNLIDVMFA